MLPWVSSDMHGALIPWYDFLVENGGFAALRFDFADYNVPYLYLLTLATLSAPWLSKVWAIKIISIVFDFVVAFFVGRCVALRYPDSKWVPKAAAMTTLLLPSVVLNSSWWGQAESVYTAFLVVCLHSLLAGRQHRAFVAFGFSFAVKLQAVFLAPLFLWLAVRKAVDWRRFFWSPLVWFVTLLPAWFIGRPFADLVTIYLRQTVLQGGLASRAQNLYQWVPDRFFPLFPLFAALAAAVLLAIAVAIHRNRLRITPERIVFLAAFAVLLAPYLLPKMHGRYFFPAEIFTLILAFRCPRYWYAPVVLQLASWNIYSRGLWFTWWVPPSWLALPVGLLLLVLARGFLRDSAPSGEAPARVRPGRSGAIGRFLPGLRDLAGSRFRPGPLVAAMTIGILLVGAVQWTLARRAETVRLEAMRRTVLAGDLDPPFLRSTYDLYLDGTQLVFYREPCTPVDTEARFLVFLHPPVPETAAPPGAGSEPQRRDFDFEGRGRLLDGACVATVELPEGGLPGIAMIEVGQWDGTPRSWRAWRRLDRARFRAALDSIASGAAGEPLVRSDFDLYLAGNELFYHREDCAPEDVEPRFFLHLFEAAEGGGDPGSRNRDFFFAERGMRLGGECLAIVPLPPEGIESVRTGQWIGDDEPFWRAVARLDHRRFRARLDSVAAGALGEPLARSTFDLYHRGRELIYHREPCTAEETEPRFFLHLFRHDRVGSGARRLFENRDFDFDRHGLVREGACLAVFDLPDGVASVRTGQRSPGQPGHWSEVVRVDFAPFRAEIEEIVSGRAGPPAARGVFDLYREGRQLRYFRDECRPEDREIPFFLQLHAADPEALPEHRREDGFEDLDFAFSHHGVLLDGRCLFRVTVPDYEMSRLRTGQRFRDGEPVWEVEIPPRR